MSAITLVSLDLDGTVSWVDGAAPADDAETAITMDDSAGSSFLLKATIFLVVICAGTSLIRVINKNAKKSVGYDKTTV